MTIRVVCTCGFSKLVPDQWAGKKAKCKCGKTISVPQVSSVDYDDEAVDPFEFLPKPKTVQVNEVSQSDVGTNPVSTRSASNTPTLLNHRNVERLPMSNLRRNADSFDQDSKPERLPLPKPHFRNRNEVVEDEVVEAKPIAAVVSESTPAEKPMKPARADSLPWVLIGCAFLLFAGAAAFGSWSYFNRNTESNLVANSDNSSESIGSSNKDGENTSQPKISGESHSTDDQGVESEAGEDVSSPPTTNSNDVVSPKQPVSVAPASQNDTLQDSDPPTVESTNDLNTPAVEAINNAIGGIGLPESNPQDSTSPIQLNMVEDLLKKELDDAAVASLNADADADKEETSGIDPGATRNAAPDPVEPEPVKVTANPITSISALDSLLLTNVLDPLTPADQLPLQDILTVDQKSKLAKINRDVIAADEKLALGHSKISDWEISIQGFATQVSDLLDSGNNAALLKILQSGTEQPITIQRLLEIYRPETTITQPAWTWIPSAENRMIESKVGRLNMPSGKGAFIGHYPGSPLVSFSANADPTKFVASVWNFKSQPNIVSRVFVDKQDLSNALASDDGRHLAVIRSKGGSMVCEIWSVETGLKFNENILSAAGDADVARPVKVTSNTAYFLSRNKLTMWDFENGGKQEIALEPNSEGRNYFGYYDFSPDNKYFVCLGKKTLTNPYQKRIVVFEVSLYDLNSLQKCGGYVYSPYDGVTDRSSIKFSPDGNQLAFLLRHGRSVVAPRRLVSLNCSDGTIQNQFEIDAYRMRRTSSSIFNRELIWLPDNSGWIVGLVKFVSKDSDEVVDFAQPQLKLHPTNPSVDPERIIDFYPTTKGKLVYMVENRQSNGAVNIVSKSARLPRAK